MCHKQVNYLHQTGFTYDILLKRIATIQATEIITTNDIKYSHSLTFPKTHKSDAPRSNLVMYRLTQPQNYVTPEAVYHVTYIRIVACFFGIVIKTGIETENEMKRNQPTV